MLIEAIQIALLFANTAGEVPEIHFVSVWAVLVAYLDIMSPRQNPWEFQKWQQEQIFDSINARIC